MKEYYGRVLRANSDLRTSACCATESLPPRIRAIVQQIHPEVREKFYGCGSPIPPALDGTTVLDLGAGSGRDCFILSRLVGANGRVIGVDMTPGQVAVARKHVEYHTREFGFARPNVVFHEGYIEDLAAIGLHDDSVDVVVSNCALNLSPDKPRVFQEIFRVLKPGGELYFSDVFADRRVPPALSQDPLLLGECLGGALYLEDFRRMLTGLGCLDYRVVARSPIELRDLEIERKVGGIGFESITIRAFKLPLEDRCEDFGQVAYYQGSVPECPHLFTLDDHHHFHTGRPMLVCGNTAAMLQHSRFARHFRVVGDTSHHHGLFDCRPAASTGPGTTAGGSCC